MWVCVLQGIAKMRAAGKLAASILSEAGKLCRPGVPTETIDEVVHRLTIDAGAYPSPLRYGKPPFPKSVCTSVNEVICHGIPDARKLRNGDIVNVDVTVWLDGYHGDTSRCVCKVVSHFPDENMFLCDHNGFELASLKDAGAIVRCLFSGSGIVAALHDTRGLFAKISSYIASI
jgi:hypothetical protein